MICTAGIDVGSTYTKAVILNEKGEILGSRHEQHGFQAGRGGTPGLPKRFGECGACGIGYFLRRGHGVWTSHGAVQRYSSDRPDRQRPGRGLSSSREHARFSTSADKR